jgi:recombinational DNA repair protein (RecF pathway)
MYALHTMPAVVIGSRAQGESNRVYRLLTRDLGFVYAAAQGVRELRNRNRYALSSGAHVSVTLVRGRETWRLTSAATTDHTLVATQLRRVLELAGQLMPVEDMTSDVYAVLMPLLYTMHDVREDEVDAIEAIAALRVLYVLGYITPIKDPVVEQYCSNTSDIQELIKTYPDVQRTVLRNVNGALATAQA